MTNYDDAFSTRPYTMRLIITQNSQNISANTSVVGWRLRVIRTGSYASFSSSGNTHSVVVNGTTVSSGAWTYDFTGTSIGDYIDIDSGTRTITHNADGTKSIAVSASATGTSIGSASKSGTFTLTTIPRASVPTFEQPAGTPVTSFEAGTSVMIQMNRASTSFTHNVSYIFGAQSGTIATGVTTDTTWTPPVTLLTEIPNSLSGSIQIVVDTYNGATFIGQTYSNPTITVPAAGTPDFGTVTNSEATTSPNVASIVGAYVKGITTLAVAITSPVGYQGSTIVSQKIEIIDPTSVVTQTINAGSGTFAPLTWSGTGTLRGTITDSRGRTHYEDVTLTVMSYSAPIIGAGTAAARATSGGVVSPTGTYIRVDLVAVVQSLIVGTQKNNLKYRVRIKTSTDATAWASVTPAASSTGIGAVTISTEVHPGIYSIANSYKVRVEIEDNLGQVSAQEFTVGTGGVHLHLSKVYDSIGVGLYYTGTANGEIMTLGRIYQRSGNKVMDETDLATTTTVGVMKKADNTITQTGTATDTAVTPASLASVVGIGTGYRLQQKVIFTSSGTFSKASYPGLRAVRVSLVGGGGAGGGSSAPGAGAHSSGSGGGGGGYAEKFILAASLSSSETVTIGAGGTGVTSAAGNTGGTTSFGSSVIATGGLGGTSANGTALSISPEGGAGGAGSTGDLMLVGTPGGNAGGNATLGMGGPGGSSLYGGGATGVYGSAGSTTYPANAATGYGGGGGGSSSNASGSPARAGGAGGSGLVIVEVYI